MNERMQIFVDLHRTGGTGGNGQGPHMQHSGGIDWKLAWQGKLELWKAFWLYFVMGHGVVLASGCAIMIFGLLAGFFIDPGSTAGGAVGVAIGAAIAFLGYSAFVIWSVVSVWRCADNCTFKIRGTYARVLMVGYVTALALPVVNVAAG